jgi:hypothetical protein
MSPARRRSLRASIPILCAWCLALTLAGVASAAPAPALGPGRDDEWIEIDFGRFIFIYPAEFAGEMDEYATLAGEAANAAYDQFARLYGEPITLPINVRVYQNTLQFARLNPLVPPLDPSMYHTHLGSREIALIAPFPASAMDARNVVNVVRHELNGLFLSALSANEMPAGLELGLNQYVEFPGLQVEDARARVRSAYDRGLLLSFSELFGTTAVYSDLIVAHPQSLSVAAFLIDSYGYASIIELAQAMAQRQGYRAAFAQVYERPVDRLEEDWLAYLPVYIESRWEHNALFSYDLAPFEEALRAGAYTQVVRGLEVVIPFLETTGQAAALLKAESLRADAARGIAAGELVAQAREALQAGDFAKALDLTEQAQASFDDLGDTSRQEEIALYVIRAREVMALRARLAEAGRQAASGHGLAAEADLAAIGPRLASLGDAAGAQTAASLLEGLRAERATRANWATLGAALVGLAVLVHRVFEATRRRRRQLTIL